MPAYCTCGAELPPDARFCHKCGKPQFDLTVAAIATDAVRVPVVTTADQVTGQAAATPILVGFHDRAAVKIGLFAALSGVLLSSLLSLLSAVWLFAAGFAAVYFYRRRTGFA